MQPNPIGQLVFQLKPTIQIEHGHVNLSMLPETAKLLAIVCQAIGGDNKLGLSEAEVAHLHTLGSLFSAALMAADAQQRGVF